MAASLKLANIWRVISDVDLDAIRAAAQTPFEIAIVGDDESLTAAVRTALLYGNDVAAAPWVRTFAADDFITRPIVPVLALIVSGTPDLPVSLKHVDEHCIRARVARVTMVVGNASPAAAARRIGEAARVAIAAPTPAEIERVASTLVGEVPGDQRLALAAALPVLRQAVAAAIVDETSKANATFALTTGLAETVPVLTAPLNLGDMVVLTKNQLLMGYRIMLASGRDGDPRAMIGEVLGVLGGGLLFRQIARQLVGLIPVIGLLPKVAVAYGGTWAMGRALTAWALGGDDVTAETVRRYSSEGLERGRATAQQMLAQVREVAPASRRSWERLRGWLPLRTRRGTPPPAAG
jgi:uncharacterized protein (DUF697 family)